MKILGLPLIAGMGLILSGCMSDGTIDNYFKRKATWASFVGGGDIKQACEAASPDHIRAFYNGDKTVQVRIYDIQPVQDAYQYRSRILASGIGHNAMPLFDPSSWVSPSDTAKSISETEWTEFKTALMNDGLTQPAPVGRTLFSGSFFWVVSGCLDGQFQFNVWEHPDPNFKALSFPAFLFARDQDRIPIHKPKGDERITSRMLSYQSYKKLTFDYYDFEVGDKEILQGRNYDPNRTY